MMNSAVFGGAEARAALELSLADSDLGYVGTDWCAGGCELWWGETASGRALFDELRNQLNTRIDSGELSPDGKLIATS